MPRYLITFDMDTTLMKEKGLSKNDRNSVYAQDVAQALAAAGFTVHLERSVYMTEDIPQTLTQVETRLLQTIRQAGRFFQYWRHVHIFRVEEWCDVQSDVNTIAAIARPPNAVP